MQLVLKGVTVSRSPQDQHLSYLATMKFGDIARLLENGHLYVPNQPDLVDFAQRKLNKTRVKAIAQYILENYEQGTIFFPPICVNIHPQPSYQDGMIFLPYDSVSMRLTDGQHRCYGIGEVLKELKNENSLEYNLISQLEIGVLLYSALPLEEERQAFRDQNLLVQRPSVSLSHYFDERNPHVLIAKELIETVPQFIDNIECIENSLGTHNHKLMSLSTLVQSIKHTFPNLKFQENLQDEIDWLTVYWKTLANTFSKNPWAIKNKQERSQQRKESLLVSAVLFQALGMLGHDLLIEGIIAEDLSKWVAKLNELDYTRKNQFWLERGVTQIGAGDEPIISNTKTTVKSCYKVLQEFLGIIS